MPSIIRVTNLENGRMIKLRVNDRGPFKSSRIIDVSRRAAQLLGFQEAGTARVRVEIDPGDSMTLKNLMIARDPGDLPQIASAPRGGVLSQPLAAPPATPVAPAKAPTVRSRGALPPLAPQPAQVANATVSLPAGTGIYIQAGAFGDQGNALKLQQQLREFGNAFIVPVTADGRQLFRVRLGPIQDGSAADDLLAMIKSYGYSDAIMVRY